MIYLFDGTENEYISYKDNNSITINFKELISKKLNVAGFKNELIHTQWLRGIGKTHNLIEYSKQHRCAVIEPSLTTAEILRSRYNYDLIYSNSISHLKCTNIKNIVIDEGVDNIDSLKNAGYNIITGFYTPKKETEDFNTSTFNILKNEIICLNSKIKLARENNDYGTYKNLILAYKEVLNIMRCFPINLS